MRGVQLFMVLVAIPFFVALGFDGYLYYFHQDKPFEFTTPGFIWTHYDPDSYKEVVQQAQDLDPRIWPVVNFVLAQKSVVDGAAFAGFFYFILLILKILGVWPFKRDSGVVHGGSRADEIMGKKKTKFKYKRK